MLHFVCELRGTIHFASVAVIPSADRGKATVKVRVALDQKDERVVPDMGVRVSFLAARPKAQAAPVPGVLLPPEALVQRDGARSEEHTSELQSH